MFGTAFLAASIASLAGCGASAGTDSSEANLQNADAPPEWDEPVQRPSSESAAEESRKSCTFAKGAMPAATLGRELPVDVDIPIKHIVVLMQENRSFDSYFGHLAKYANRNDIESAPEAAANPESTATPDGPQHPYQHARDLCFSDTNHEWAGSHREYNGGKMDGFYEANQLFIEDGQPKVDPSLLSGERALFWYDERDIPFYYALASTFAIGDHYFSSVMGPTWPNRDYFYAGTSRGKTTNKRPDLSGLDFPAHDTVIFHELQRRKVDWQIFVDGALKAPRIGTFLSVGTVFWRLKLGTTDQTTEL
jgi:phospholipase C